MTADTMLLPPERKTRGKQAVARHPRGYIHGKANAERYLSMDHRTFDKHVLPHVKPRILGKDTWWKISELDRFMDPDRNAPGAETEFRSKVTTTATVSQ